MNVKSRLTGCLLGIEYEYFISLTGNACIVLVHHSHSFFVMIVDALPWVGTFAKSQETRIITLSISSIH